MGNRKNIILLGLGLLIVTLFGSLVNPKSKTMTSVVIFLLLLMFIFFLVSNLILNLSSPYMSHKKKYLLSLILGFIPVYLLAISSLSSLKIVDVIFALITAFVCVWYINRVVK